MITAGRVLQISRAKSFTWRFLRRSPLCLKSYFGSNAASSEECAALKYSRKSAREHILLRPDTYIGSVTPVREQRYLFDQSKHSLERVACSYVPGLLKIFDEILVNAADNKQRDANMTEIKIDVDRNNGIISIYNDGQGLPIVIHPVEKVYVPTLIFGSLFTSSNYDDLEIKTVGGRNGYGAKLCNIYSSEFIVETVSKKQGLSFHQKWSNNMTSCCDPIVAKSEASDYTKIVFRPDLARFGLSCLDVSTEKVFLQRAIEISATLQGVNVFFNGHKISVDSFRDYISMHANDFLYLNISRRWQVALALSRNGYRHTSFVNNIATTNGGKHVDYIMDQVIPIVKKGLWKAIGSSKPISSHLIRAHIWLFVNCLIENPTFGSQSKDQLTTRARDFGSVAIIDEDSVLSWAESSGLISTLMGELANKKSPSPSKRRNLQSIQKLEDANWAGTKKGQESILLVTEGDSAKALAVAGLEVVGRDRYGVFPLRGKIINVSHMEAAKALENSEIRDLVRILGLQFGIDYSIPSNLNTLRYGQLMILADQDEDGSHIKGLILNLFRCYWPELLDGGYLSMFRTPLIKARMKGETLSFYSAKEFKQWSDNEAHSAKYSIKYYKGLGTSTSAEAREYFADMSRHVVRFCSDGKSDRDRLRMAFDKENAEERRAWIEERCSASVAVDDDSKFSHAISNDEYLSICDFVDEELITFSILDLKRSIPSAIDGLKPSQRKVLHTLFQTADRKELKVNQLAGAVSLQQAYRHGEDSLVNTIIRMAQDYVGSNNVPLLRPIGQFGTRHEGGNDAASARYIHTRLSPIARLLFPASDDHLLQYEREDDIRIEPTWYCPIVPLVLVNGAEGIGTGWATRILPHNIQDVIENVQRTIEGREWKPLVPYWNGFRGSIQEVGCNRYEITGNVSMFTEKNKIGLEIDELPIGVWTSKYKERVLMPLMAEGLISDIFEHHSEGVPHFRVVLKDHLYKKTSLEKIRRKFKLTSTLSCNSMVLFDQDGALKKYKNTHSIFSEYFRARQNKYEDRLQFSLAFAEAQCLYVANQLRFVDSIVSGKINLQNLSRGDLQSYLLNAGFSKDPVAHLKEQGEGSLSYLLDMPLHRFTSDEMMKLAKRAEKLEHEKEAAASLNWQDEWLSDLDKLKQAGYESWRTVMWK